MDRDGCKQGGATTASITIRNLDDEVHIENGDVLDIIRHPNASRYPNQRVIVLNVEGYVYLVPYVEQKGTRFLKTIIPSRKATKEYLK